MIFCDECGELIREEDMTWTYGAPLCRRNVCIKLREGEDLVFLNQPLIVCQIKRK